MSAKPAKAAISWSAGKDSCLAWRRAVARGLPVPTFLTMMDDRGLSKSHALPEGLVRAQVRAMGGDWWPAAVAPGAYVAVFRAQLERLRDTGHTHLVFGDIDLQAHRDFLEPLCAAHGLQPVFPLWGEPRAAVARAVIDAGIRARLACVDTRWLDASFCGADYDDALIGRLPPGVCPCGEGGEFHTFVFDAPGFSAPLRLVPAGQRRERSTPPLAPTELVFQSWEWDDLLADRGGASLGGEAPA